MEHSRWEITLDKFEADTPIGRKTFTNIIATLDPHITKRLVLSAHYDSKYDKKGKFLGATDSAVPVAMILDLVLTVDSKLQNRGVGVLYTSIVICYTGVLYTCIVMCYTGVLYTCTYSHVLHWCIVHMYSHVLHWCIVVMCYTGVRLARMVMVMYLYVYISLWYWIQTWVKYISIQILE